MKQDFRLPGLRGATNCAHDAAQSIIEVREHVRTRKSQERLVSKDSTTPTSNTSPLNVRSAAPLRRKSKFTGWRVGALAAAGLALLCLVVNLTATAWLASHVTFEDDLARIYRGDCGSVKQINIALHLAINILSTLLLGGSNYCMQCLVAPTRDMINEAHHRGKWLDIGIPSVRNLRSAPPLHIVLWLSLLASSLPLHLLYNSSIYLSITTYPYDVYVASNISVDDLRNQSAFYNHRSGNVQWEILTNAECIRAYEPTLTVDRSDVIVVTTAQNISARSMSLYGYLDYGPFISSLPWVYTWICSGQVIWSEPRFPAGGNRSLRALPDKCSGEDSKVEPSPSAWAPFGSAYPASHCVSRREPQLCGLNANISILVTVVICNSIKCLIMVYVAFFLNNSPLLVIGDAVDSFLVQRDMTTRTAGLISRQDVVQSTRRSVGSPPTHHYQHVAAPGPRNKTGYLRRWSSASRARWSSTIMLFCLSIGMSIALLAHGVRVQFPEKSIKYIWSLGYGEVNAVSMITPRAFHSEGFLDNNSKSVIGAILTANAPQLMLSILYFNWNSLLTSICLTIEWTKFATKPNMLRVSNPKAGQKSSYFLTIPYRYAVPFLIASVSLHWSISQSIFLSVVNEINPRSGQGSLFIACGYSGVAIITTCIIGSLVLFAVLGMGIPQIKTHIPIAGSCSAAISAACHPPETELDTTLKPIKWGVIPGSMDDSHREHCALSSGEVDEFVPGLQYW